MGKTAVEEPIVAKKKKKVTLQVPKKTAAKTDVKKKKKTKPKAAAAAAVVPVKQKKAKKATHKVRVLNDKPFYNFAKELAESYGVSRVSEEAKEAFNASVYELADGILRRLFRSTRDLTTVKDRHVVNVVAQEVIARRHGRTDLLSGVQKASADIGQKFTEVFDKK